MVTLRYSRWCKKRQGTSAPRLLLAAQRPLGRLHDRAPVSSGSRKEPITSSGVLLCNLPLWNGAPEGLDRAGVTVSWIVVRGMYILFARRDANQPWMRIRTTKQNTNPVALKVATAKARQWLDTGWMVQAVNVATQEAHALS